MNISEVLFRVKSEIGIYGLALPLENPDKDMTDVITNITLKTFSQFQPYYENFQCNVNDLERISKIGNEETYLLPDFHERPILFVSDVYYSEGNLSGLGYWGGGMPLVTGNVAQQMMLSNVSSNMIQHMLPKMTFKFSHPRKLTLYNMYNSCSVLIVLAREHDKSLASIPDTCYESFLELAILDIKNFLYNIMKHYTELETAWGRVSVKIDDWANADQERKDLISRWSDTYHLDQTSIYWG